MGLLVQERLPASCVLQLGCVCLRSLYACACEVERGILRFYGQHVMGKWIQLLAQTPARARKREDDRAVAYAYVPLPQDSFQTVLRAR